MNRNLITPLIFIVLAAGITPAVLTSADSVQSNKIAHMGSRNFQPQSHYNYTFGAGSRDIHDGSDFQAVRNAFGTWIGEPDSALSASETMTSGPTSNGYNGLNEIAWINPTKNLRDPWSNLLGLADRAVATVVTWYNSVTRQVVERDLYFNNVDYTWRTDTDGRQNGGFYVENVALHEIGHIFGLRDLYNPHQPGWEPWMGENNQEHTMYGYTNWQNEDITLSYIDIAAMAMLHPASVPEPRSISLLTLTAGMILVIRRR